MNEIFQADTVLINGKIITVDQVDSIVEAVAIKDGKFIATGSTEEMKELTGRSTEVIDLEGKTGLPGIIDSHTHPAMAAALLKEINCRQSQVKRIHDILMLVKERAEEVGPGKWVKGSNFNFWEVRNDEKKYCCHRMWLLGEEFSS